MANELTGLLAALSDPRQRARLPAGMRNNNPGNIKYVGQAGTHPSVNTDQGDPQAVYDTPESGMHAMYGLLSRKYQGGKRTANDIIAASGGWTPGNYQAAANVARNAGIRPDQDINFGDPQMAARFMRGLMLQEHGNSSQLYPDSLITASISGAPFPMPSLGGVTDGPKGQEVYTPAPDMGTTAGILGGPAGGILGDVPQDVVSHYQSLKDEGQQSPLQKLFAGLADTKGAPAPQFGQFGDARSSGDALLKFVQSLKGGRS